MSAKYFYTTVPGSILLGSTLIAISILISSGVIKIKGQPERSIRQAEITGTQPSGNILAAKPSIPSEDSIVKVSVGDDPVLGKKDAQLTLIEFSDYECPFCQKSFNELLPELKKNYIDKGLLKLVYKDLPLDFHANAAKEAEAANCAREQGGDIAYFKYHDQIFTNTTGGGTGISLDELPSLAGNIGLNVSKFENCLDSGKYKDEIEKDLAEAAEVRANGTPAWFIGKTTANGVIEGTRISGAQPFSRFKPIIEDQLKK